MASTIKTCGFCGKLFQSLGPPHCPQCSNKLDQDFIKVREYLYSNKSAALNATEISENTGVSEKAVLYFIKEGRLARKEGGEKSGVKCAACGTPILSGKLCAKCASAWKNEASTMAKAAEKPDGQTERNGGIRMHTKQD